MLFSRFLPVQVQIVVQMSLVCQTVLMPELCLLDKTASEISKRFVPLLFKLDLFVTQPPMHKPFIFTISTSCIYVVGIRVQTR